MPIVPARSGDPCQHGAVPDDDLPPQAPRPDASVPGPDEPESACELLQRGTALMRRRHNAQAAVVLERAARLEPGKGSILEALGRACFTSGQYERARETFEALLEVDPSSHYGHSPWAGASRTSAGRARHGPTCAWPSRSHRRPRCTGRPWRDSLHPRMVVSPDRRAATSCGRRACSDLAGPSRRSTRGRRGWSSRR